MNAIEISDLEFFYPADPKKQILNINSWQVTQGNHLFIHGDSGSGKSTLLNLICGIHRANKGAVKVLGENLNELSGHKRDKFRANHIGYIFQQFNLIEYLDAIDNIKLAATFSKNTSAKNLDDDIKSLLSKLKVDSLDWHKPVNQLSIGQQQRIGIARALINKPKLIIADEPTSSLDQSARNSFMSLLISLCQEHDSTLLFVSHDMSLQSHFKSVVALSEINNIAGIK